MADSVLLPDADLVTVTVEVNGSKIDETYLVESIETENALNRIAKATVSIVDGSRVDETFVISSSSDFEPGAKIKIKAGYHAKEQTIFDGVIVGQRVSAHTGGASSLRVSCADAALKLTVARTASQYYDAKDSDTISSILSKAGLSKDVSESQAKLAQQVRSHATDWDFILARAEANGHVVLVDGGKVTVGPPKFETAAWKAEYGVSILDLDLSLDAGAQLSAVAAKAWDPKSQKVVSASSSEPTVNSQGNLTGKKLADVLGAGGVTLLSQGDETADTLQTWAKAYLLKSRLARFRGRVSTPGNAGLKTGTQVELDGLGTRFDGAAYITGVRHRIGNGDWQTEMTFGLDAGWFADMHRDLSPAPAGATRPGVTGLEIATVLKTDDDPEKERRVKVALPLHDDGEQGIWVRIASPYASNGFGMEFLPEVGDEVVLGFVNGDPSAAILLGSLHSSARPSPIEPDADNTLKTLVTKAQHKMTFDDDKKIITVETPGGHKLVMSDDAKSITVTDSNSNKIEMAEGGITVSSPKDITIDAKGSVAIKGQAGVTVSSPADVGIKGMNVTAEAEIGLTAKGNASAELSAAGETTVKGAMVMIN